MAKGRKGGTIVARSNRSKFGGRPKETPDPARTAAFPSPRSGARENGTALLFFFFKFHPQLFATANRNSNECLTRESGCISAREPYLGYHRARGTSIFYSVRKYRDTSRHFASEYH